MKLLSKLLPSLTALAAFCLLPRQAQAQTVTWTDSTGNWNVPGDWSGGVVPGSGTNVEIDTFGPALPSTVSGTAANILVGESFNFGQAAGFTISGGTLSDTNASIGDGVNFGGNNFSTTGSAAVSSGSWNTSGTLTLGDTSPGILNFTGGKVNAGQLVLGNAAGVSGTLSMTSGTLTLSQPGGTPDFVGKSGNGTLTLNGGVLTDNQIYLYVGGTTGGSGLISMQSGTWNGSVDIHVGQVGSGTFVMNSGSFIAWAVRLGNSTGAVGTGTWSGGSGLLQYMVVGGNSGGTGSFLLSGGLIRNVAGIMGDYANSSGTATVTGGTWMASSGSMIVGNRSQGVLNLQGGLVSGSDAIIGNTDLTQPTLLGNSSGTANVTGGTFASAATLTIGTQTGTGVLNVNGGYVSNANAFIGTGTVFAGALGGLDVATVTSGTWASGGTLTVGGTFSSGKLVVNGGYVSSLIGLIDSGPGQTAATAQVTSGTWADSTTLRVGNTGVGNLSVSGGNVTDSAGIIAVGNGSAGMGFVGSGSWINSGSLVAGSLGSGTLNLAGGWLSDANGALGSGSSGIGSGTVSSGTWSNTTTLYVGYSGRGFLAINGGYVSDPIGNIGNNAGSAGMVIVSSGTWSNDQRINVGVSGTGTLWITGGQVSDLWTSIAGTGTVSSGSAMISGGTWTNANDLYVGVGGTGSLQVNGGYVSDTRTIAGDQAGSAGTAAVTGGTLSTSGSFVVGNSGTGVLNISGGGVVNVGSGTGTVQLAYGLGAAGTLNYAGGTLNAAAVNGRPGSSAVNFTGSGTHTFAPQLTGGLNVNQTGAGITMLAGSNSYTGSTNVTQGVLQVNGSIASSSGVAISSGGTLAGSGVVSNISGAGAVAPGGNSILTASQADPTGGMSYAFHMSGTGSPNYAGATASVNDVLHLAGATPLTSAMTSANVIAVDFTGLVLQSGQIYYGGFFTDAAIASAMVQNATFSYTGLGGATVQFAGMTTVASAAFTTGTVSNGEVMEFDVTGAPVPAAPPWALLLAGAGLLIAAGRRVKA